MAVRAGGAVDPGARLERLIGALEPEIRAAFATLVVDVVSHTKLNELAELLAVGAVDEALASLNAAAGGLATAVNGGFRTTGSDTARFLSGNVLTVRVGFDETNERAVQITRDNRLRLVREFTGEQRRAVRAVLTQGVQEGINPREMAVRFRHAIGLTEKQAAAVQHYRILLENTSKSALSRTLRDRRFDRSVQRAIRTRTPLTKTQIDRMVAAYQRRYINFRAVTIARTEALRAVHQGAEEMYQQAIDEGQLAPESLLQTWVTARDERVRGSHAEMDGQQRSFDQAFTSGDGFALRYPGDPEAPASEVVNCRCVRTMRIDAI